MNADIRSRQSFVGRFSRRGFVGAASVGIAAAAAGLVGCSSSNNKNSSNNSGAKPAASATAAGGQAAASATAAAAGTSAATRAATPASTPAAAAAQPKPGGTLIWQNGGSPATLDDFAIGGTAQPSRVSGFAYSALLAFRHGQPSVGPADVSVEPELAVALPEQPDPLTFSMKLKPAKFHNGRALTSDDVKYAYDRAANAAPFKQSRSWYDHTETPDPQTVVIKLKSPFADTLQTMGAATNDGFIVPKEQAEGPDAATKQMGSGPYLFGDFQPDVGMSWKRNPDYYGKPAPYFDAVKALFTSDPAKRVADFSSKQVNYSWWFTGADRKALKSNRPDAKFEDIPNPANYIFTRADKAPFNDPRVRQALSMGINRKAINDAVFGGEGQNDQALFVGNTYWGARPVTALGDAAKYWNYDPQAAKQLLKAAGFDTLTFMYNHADPSVFGQDYIDHVTLTVAQWKDIGVTAQDNTQARNVFITSTGLGNYEGIGINGRLPDTVMSRYLTDYMYTSPTGQRGNQNAGYVNDPQLNTLLEKQSTQYNLDDRKATMRQIEDVMAGGQWFIEYTTYPISYFWDPSVQFVRPVIFIGNMQYAARRWWIDKP